MANSVSYILQEFQERLAQQYKLPNEYNYTIKVGHR